MKFSESYLVYNDNLVEEIVYSYADCMKRIDVLVEKEHPLVRKTHFDRKRRGLKGVFYPVSLKDHIDNILNR